MSAFNRDFNRHAIAYTPLSKQGWQSLIDAACRAIGGAPQGQRKEFCFPDDDAAATRPIIVQRKYWATWCLDGQVVVTGIDGKELWRGTYDSTAQKARLTVNPQSQNTKSDDTYPVLSEIELRKLFNTACIAAKQIRSSWFRHMVVFNYPPRDAIPPHTDMAQHWYFVTMEFGGVLQAGSRLVVTRGLGVEVLRGTYHPVEAAKHDGQNGNAPRALSGGNRANTGKHPLSKHHKAKVLEAMRYAIIREPQKTLNECAIKILYPIVVDGTYEPSHPEHTTHRTPYLGYLLPYGELVIRTTDGKEIMRDTIGCAWASPSFNPHHRAFLKQRIR